jgi:ankyrin repeat protein
MTEEKPEITTGSENQASETVPTQKKWLTQWAKCSYLCACLGWLLILGTYVLGAGMFLLIGPKNISNLTSNLMGALSIGSFVSSLILSVIAAISGAVVLIGMRKKNSVKGKGNAIKGLIFSSLYLVIMLVISIFMMNEWSYSEHYKEIHTIVMEGNFDKVKSLLSETPELVNVKTNFGNTPLHIAIRKKHDEIAKFLISKGANINAQNKGGSTPLAQAASDGNKEMVELLLANGANVNIGDPLGWAAFNGNKEVIRLLLAKGSEVDSKSNRGSTALKTAVFMGHKDATELLIAKGADINFKTNDGNSLLHIAAERDCRDVAEVLIAKGLNVNIKNKNGETPLHLAIKYNRKETTELLRKYGGTE